MKYRMNRRTGDRISEIGMGTAYIVEAPREKAMKTIRRAFESGINYYDLAAGDGSAFALFGEALSDVRDQVMYQIHFGADYSKITYGWTLELDDNGILDYILKLKQEGVVRHIGASSHTPSVIREIIDADVIDMLMFSVNPAYDYQQGEYAFGGVDERALVYQRCESLGIGITVMKPFSGGQLLDEKTSPFGRALTPYQCIKYALDKPGVLAVLPGIQTTKELTYLLKYYEQPEDALDYSVIGSFAPPEAAGKCVYCNHCAPCPMGLEISAINKFYDLARIGDGMAREHYLALSLHAGDCIGCGHCNSRCPFSVDQVSRMQEIQAFFGQ